MNIKCPWCGADCMSDVDLVEGQHVLCLSCGKKFAYNTRDGLGALAADRRQDSYGPVSLKKYWPIVASILVVLAVVLLFATETGRRIVGNTLGFAVGLAILIAALYVVVRLGRGATKRSKHGLQYVVVKFLVLSTAVVLAFVALGLFVEGWCSLPAIATLPSSWYGNVAELVSVNCRQTDFCAHAIVACGKMFAGFVFAKASSALFRSSDRILSILVRDI